MGKQRKTGTRSRPLPAAAGEGTAERAAASKHKGTPIQRQRIPELKAALDPGLRRTTLVREKEGEVTGEAPRTEGAEHLGKTVPPAASGREQGRARLRSSRGGDGPAMPRRGWPAWAGLAGHSSGQGAQGTGSPTSAALKC